MEHGATISYLHSALMREAADWIDATLESQQAPTPEDVEAVAWEIAKEECRIEQDDLSSETATSDEERSRKLAEAAIAGMSKRFTLVRRVP
jgi:hypothetical protein